MKRKLMGLLLSMVMAFGLVPAGAFTAFADVQPADDTVITVSTQVGKGDPVVAKTYTADDLSSLATSGERFGYMYMKNNAWRVLASDSYVLIPDLMSDASVDTYGEGSSVKFAASDGFSTTASFETLSAPRYFYTDTEPSTAIGDLGGNAVEVPPIITLNWGSEDVVTTAGDALDAITTDVTDPAKMRNFYGILPSDEESGGKRFCQMLSDITVMSKEDISTDSVKLAETSYPVGSEPEPVVTDANGNVMVKDVDYTLSYTDNDAVGTATVTATAVSGSQYYTGAASTTFTVVPAAAALSVYEQTGKGTPTLVKEYSADELTALAGTGDTRYGYMYFKGTAWKVLGSDSYITVPELMTDAAASGYAEGCSVKFAAGDGFATTTDYQTLSETRNFYGDAEPSTPVADLGGTVTPVPSIIALNWGSADVTTTAADALAAVTTDATTIRDLYGLLPDDANTGGNRFCTGVADVTVITKEDLSGASVTGVEPYYTKTGSAITPEPVVTDANGNTLVKDVDYTLSYANNTAPGTASVTITATPGSTFYTGSATKTFTITDEDVVLIVNTKLGQGDPVEAKHYTATELKALAGTGDVRQGYMYNKAGNWKVLASDSYITIPELMTDASVSGYAEGCSVQFAASDGFSTTASYQTLSETRYFYGDTEPSTPIADLGGTATPVTPVLALNWGSESVTTTAADALEAITTDVDDPTKMRDFYGILPTDENSGGNRFAQFLKVITVMVKEDIADATVSDLDKVYKPTGSPIEPTITLTDAAGKVIDPSNYQVTYKDNTDVGTATIIIKGIGNEFTGEKEVTFKIADSKMNFIELQGPDRYATAAAEATYSYPAPDGANGIVIAGGEAWPDALAGTGLAGVLDYPVLLTDSKKLTPATETAMKTILAKAKSAGTAKIVILGGNSAVSDSVESALASYVGSANVVRLAGDNRVETAEKIYAYGKDKGLWKNHSAIVATGANFPDALSASAVAASAGIPIFLADAGTLSAQTVKDLNAGGFTDAMIAGGVGVVSADSESQVARAVGGAANVTRCGGASRYDTSLLVADYAVSKCGMTWDCVAYASGEKAPDALAGSVVQGKDDSILLLANDATIDAITAHKAEIDTVKVFGGTGAVSQQYRDKIKSNLGWF